MTKTPIQYREFQSRRPTVFTFKDNAGTQRAFRLGVRQIKNVIDETGVDLREIFDDTTPMKDPQRLALILHVLLRPAETPEGFSELLVGQPMEDAAYALLEAVANYLPDREREIALAIIARSKQEEQERQDAILAAVRVAPAARPAWLNCVRRLFGLK
jgi:hypothetical protein